MEIREIKEQEKEKFNKTVGHPVQSWEWGEFRQTHGNKILRLGLFDKGRLKEGFQLTIHGIPKTNFRVAMFTQGPEPSAATLKGLKEFAQKENLVFVRIEPAVVSSPKLESLITKNNLKPSRPFFNKSTYLIDLTKSEKELLSSMHSKTRYNIRLAERHGVEVIEDNSTKAFGKYLELMDQTTTRQKYYAHTEKYHRLMWQTLNPAGIAHLLVTKYKGKILNTWILFIWHNHLYYPYGASSEEHREVMASYAAMWGAIKFGKANNLKTFDLWGADDTKGYTRFKEGFGGKKVEFAGTWDLIINPTVYLLYRIAEELRWKALKLKTRIFPFHSSFRAQD